MLRALQLTHPGIVEFFASVAATATHEALMAGLFKVLGRTAQLLVQTDPFHVLYRAGAARDAWFHAAGANFTIARMCVLARSMWRYAQGAQLITDIPVLIPQAVNVSGGTAWFCFTSALNAIVVQGGGGIPLVVGGTQLISDISGWVGNLIYVPPPAVPPPPTAAPVSVGSAEQPR